MFILTATCCYTNLFEIMQVGLQYCITVVSHLRAQIVRDFQDLCTYVLLLLCEIIASTFLGSTLKSGFFFLDSWSQRGTFLKPK